MRNPPLVNKLRLGRRLVPKALPRKKLLGVKKSLVSKPYRYGSDV
jgi:hypothetical protein